MKENYLGKDIPKLGFGLMRLPEIDGVIDIEQVKKMVDLFIEAGFSYFDSAYVYHGGKSEEAIKTAIIDRHPREKVKIATKLPLWNMNVDVRKVFNEQLERTGAGYFDFYLIHGLGLERCNTPGIEKVFEVLAELKAEGKIKHLGFSTHDNAENVDKILTMRPELEFVMVQFNYVDYESAGVQARGCYEAALKHNVPITFMEPVRGGTLVTLPDEIVTMYKGINPDDSIASWAIRYCLEFKEGLITVLSGMSSIEQVEDNLKTMKNYRPLSGEEKAAIARAVEIIKGIDQIPCTYCRYCVDDCPQKINIPGFIRVDNEYRIYKNMTVAKRSMGFVRGAGGTPGDCTSCGACEKMCPQNIKIIDLFNDFKETFLKQA